MTQTLYSGFQNNWVLDLRLFQIKQIKEKCGDKLRIFKFSSFWRFYFIDKKKIGHNNNELSEIDL